MSQSPPVYTYYMPVPGLWPEDTQLKLIDLWAESWRKRGWEPIVLGESHARRHPRFKEFKQKFWELPTEYGHDYEGACLMRYVAVAAMGGGMLTDYDVMNYSVTPERVEKLQAIYDSPQFFLFCNRPPRDVFAGAFFGCPELYEGVSQIFYSWEIDKRDFVQSSTYTGYHCSDLSMLMQIFDGRRTRPDWLQLAPGCVLYPEEGWQTAPMVHYGYAMKTTGHWPKYEGIPKLRPI